MTKAIQNPVARLRSGVILFDGAEFNGLRRGSQKVEHCMIGDKPLLLVRGRRIYGQGEVEGIMYAPRKKTAERTEAPEPKKAQGGRQISERTVKSEEGGVCEYKVEACRTGNPVSEFGNALTVRDYNHFVAAKGSLAVAKYVDGQDVYHVAKGPIRLGGVTYDAIIFNL